MAEMLRQCLFQRTFIDEQGGSQIGIFRLADNQPFALAEAEQWLVADSERPCTVHCSAIPPELKKAVKQIIGNKAKGGHAQAANTLELAERAATLLASCPTGE